MRKGSAPNSPRPPCQQYTLPAPVPPYPAALSPHHNARRPLEHRRTTTPYIGIAFETAFPVSTGNASTLNPSVPPPFTSSARSTYFFPASVAQQQQRRLAGQQTIYSDAFISGPCASKRGESPVNTHRHDDCDAEAQRWADHFAMARVLVAAGTRLAVGRAGGRNTHVPHWKHTMGRGIQSIFCNL